MEERFLEGTAAVVTGAGRGIGRAIARRLAEAGATVVLAARTESEIREAAEEIRSAGGRAVAVPTDVSDEEQIDDLFRRADETGFPIETVVLNAGIAVFRPCEELTAEDWDRTFAVNVRGAFLATRRALARMKPRKRGTILFTASTASLRGYPRQSAYCASKHALLGFARALALETAPFDIRVHAICPGGVDTRLVREARDDVAFEEYMRPEEVAEVALFLLGMRGTARIDQVVVRRSGSEPWRVF